MKILLEGLLPHFCPGLQFACIAHEGKQDLERSIPGKRQNWQEPGVRFVIMRDDDKADCRDLKARRANLCVQGGRSDAWVRIVCQELAGWHLGEPDALAAVYGNEPLRDRQGKARYRQPDAVAHPAQERRRLIPGFGKFGCARRRAQALTEAGNRSSSYKSLPTGCPVRVCYVFSIVREFSESLLQLGRAIRLLGRNRLPAGAACPTIRSSLFVSCGQFPSADLWRVAPARPFDQGRS